jgi:hypothetical protein
MTDKYEKNTKLVVLQAIPNHQQLVKVNRWLLATVFFLMSVIVLAGIFLFPSDELSDYKQTAVKTETVTPTNPNLTAEVNALKGQFVGVVSSSIDSKLKTLEKTLRSGKNPEALATIEELRNDISTLRAYSANASTNVVKPIIPNEQLIEEMSELKRLVYISLASCLLLLMAVAGIWIKNRYRLPHKEETITHYLRKD